MIDFGPVLRAVPFLTLVLFMAPIVAGTIGTLLPAFDYLPAIGRTDPSLDPWRALVNWPGFGSAVRLTMTIGLGASLLSLLVALGLVAWLQGTRWLRRLERLLTPVLAAPHASVALGAAFLFAPSGWAVRLISPWATGWTQPPAIVTIQDPWGLACIAGLLVKEVPYLLLMLVGAGTQVPVGPSLAASRALGYAPRTAWLKVVLPLLYPQVRLPIYAVLAFSLSTVEVALVLGPGNPPTLAVQAARWFADPNVQLYPQAAAAATLTLILIVASIALWRVGEAMARGMGRAWIWRGDRQGVSEGGSLGFGLVGGVVGVVGLLTLMVSALWSVAAVWRFPDAVPARWSLATWQAQLPDLGALAGISFVLATLAAAIALGLAALCLENEQRHGIKPGAGALWLLYTPLLVPQIAFLFGVQVLLISVGFDGWYAAVVWAHLLFVLPYVFLSLADPWRALDPRYVRTARALGASPGRVFLAIKLPMLLRPLLVALAVGFAVSIGQYLPTLFAGAGRIATLTTEAVTLSSGADRRVVAVYAFLQAVLPLAVYGLAIGIPALIYRDRRGVR